jgi:hypothetical protein
MSRGFPESFAVVHSVNRCLVVCYLAFLLPMFYAKELMLSNFQSSHSCDLKRLQSNSTFTSQLARRGTS